MITVVRFDIPVFESRPIVTAAPERAINHNPAILGRRGTGFRGLFAESSGNFCL
jgi:hypothetical protein